MMLRELAQEIVPVDIFAAWLRQFRKLCVATDESVEMTRAVFDRVEHGGETIRIAALREQTSGMGER